MKKIVALLLVLVMALALAACGSGGENRVQLVAAFANEGRVAENAGRMQAVIPGDDAGVAAFGLGPVALDVIAVLLGKQGVFAHIIAHQAAGNTAYSQDDKNDIEYFFH